MSTILMYVVKSESEIPNQLTNNTAYYILGKEVRMVDEAGQLLVFKMNNKNELEQRVALCEKQIGKIINHMTSFNAEV